MKNAEGVRAMNNRKPFLQPAVASSFQLDKTIIEFGFLSLRLR